MRGRLEFYLSPDPSSIPESLKPSIDGFAFARARLTPLADPISMFATTDLPWGSGPTAEPNPFLSAKSNRFTAEMKSQKAI